MCSFTSHSSYFYIIAISSKVSYMSHILSESYPVLALSSVLFNLKSVSNSLFDCRSALNYVLGRYNDIGLSYCIDGNLG